MKHTKLFLLVTLFLASCTPSIQSPSQVHAATAAPVPTATQTPSPTPTIVPTPTPIGGGSGRFIFELGKAEFSKMFPDLKGDQNVFIANEDGTGLTPVTNGLDGYNYVENISPDGTKVLIASGSDRALDNPKFTDLYSIDLNSLDSAPQKVATGLIRQNGWWPIAKWVDNTRLVYIAEGKNGLGINIINSDGTNSSNIYKYNNDGALHEPVGILTVNGTRVYWYSELSWDKNYPWWSSTDGLQQGTLNFKGKQMVFDNLFHPLAFSQDGSVVIWLEPRTSNLFVASISSMDSANELEGQMPFPNYRMAPDGSKIVVFNQYVVQMQKVQQWDANDDLFGIYTISTSPSLPVTNLHRSDVLDVLVPPDTRGYGVHCNSSMGNISPDGRQIIMYVLVSGSDCQAKPKLLNLEAMSLTNILTGLSPRDVQWLAVTQQLTATITQTPIPMATSIRSPEAIATAIGSSAETQLFHMNLEQLAQSPVFANRGNWTTKSVAGSDLLEASSSPTAPWEDAAYLAFGTSAWANYLLGLRFNFAACTPSSCEIIIKLRIQGAQGYDLVIDAKTGLLSLEFAYSSGWKSLYHGINFVPVKLPMGSWHSLLVSVDRDAISASVDSTSTVAVADNRVTAGPIAIELAPGTTAQFKDISVWSIPSNVP